jgi:hypothetical protein
MSWLRKADVEAEVEWIRTLNGIIASLWEIA